MTVKCTMILGDCLEVMSTLNRSIYDMVFSDLPYLCTANKWDKSFDLNGFWKSLKGLAVKTAAYVFPATTRFAIRLIQGSIVPYRYDLVWHKTHATGFLNVKRMPLRAHESLLFFYYKLPVYNPQMTDAKTYQGSAVRSLSLGASVGYEGLKNGRSSRSYSWVDNGKRFPVSVLTVPCERKQSGIHPTQKPVALLDWLIRTYSNPGDNVLDPVSGSFTTCVSACLNGRNSVGIEKDPAYFEAGVERVRKTVRDNNLDVKLEVRR